MDGLALTLVVIGLAFAWRAISRDRAKLRSLAATVESLEAQVQFLRRGVESAQVAPHPGAADEAPAAAKAAPESLESLAKDWKMAIPRDEATAVTPAPAPELPASPAPVNRPAVLSPDLGRRLAAFLQANWVFVVAAVSLSLAGLFLVQYGIERGLLTPTMRVAAAIALGLGLVAWGERLRRRPGPVMAEARGAVAATFSGAGIVSIFVAVLAARQMYDLIGPGMTLAGLVATSALAIVLGWFNGPFLAAVGLAGAAASPFLTGGGGQAPDWFYLFYALVAVIGLGIDTLRRWAWLSVAGVALAFAGGGLSLSFGADPKGWILLMVALPLLATVVPERGLMPRQAGPSLIALRFRGLPAFPARLVAGTLGVASLGLIQAVSGSGEVAIWALIGLTVLALAYLTWAEAAPGLTDLPALPALGLLAAVALAATGLPIWQGYMAQAIDLRPPETAAPHEVSWIVAMALALALAAGWRSLRAGTAPQDLAQELSWGAVGIAPAVLVALHLGWQPDQVMGAFPWALHVMAGAVLMVGLALRYASRDGADHRRTGLAALMALSLIAFSLGIVATGVALTLALAALMAVAAGLDRRFDLSAMGLFQQAAVAVLTARILVDPGLDWAIGAPLADFLMAFTGPIAAAVLAWRFMASRERRVVQGVLESGAALWIVAFLDMALFRWLDRGGANLPDYLAAALLALPWIGGVFTQTYRMQLTPVLRRLRLVLAALSGLVAAGLTGLSTLFLNPLISGPSSGRVIGPMLADSLALAYLVPGMILIAGGLRLPGLGPILRRVLAGLGAALTLLYLGLEIRRFWQGDWLGGGSVKQGELYTYTIAMMLLGAGLLAAALARHSPTLRRIAMAGIAVTIAKVFLIDAAGLTGLTRVASFLGLGLSLAGLAWLNRWVEQATRAPTAPSEGPADPPAAP